MTRASNQSSTSTPLQLLTLTEVGKRLGICRTSLWKLLGTGALPWVDVLGRRRISERDLEAYVKAHRSQR